MILWRRDSEHACRVQQVRSYARTGGRESFEQETVAYATVQFQELRCGQAADKRTVYFDTRKALFGLIHGLQRLYFPAAQNPQEGMDETLTVHTLKSQKSFEGAVLRQALSSLHIRDCVM